MWSYTTLFSIQADPVFAERAEMLAFNALPAELTEDMWSHQYLQQTNAMSVRQLRHRFGPRFAHFSAPPHPTHAVSRVLLGAQSYLTPIGAWNPML